MGLVSYEDDYAAWALANARMIRSGRISELDLEHLAEELESMGKKSQRELVSRLTILLMHLLKWKMQPNLRNNSWKATIRHQRYEIQDLLEESPSLLSGLEHFLDKAYERARVEAATETGLADTAFPARCEWKPSDVLSQDFWPE